MKTKIFVKSLDDAYEQKYFTGGIPRDALIQAVQAKYPEMRVHDNPNHSALVYRNRFICGISRLSRIPKFMLMDKKTGEVFCRSWEQILRILRSKGYDIRKEDIDRFNR